MKCKCLSLIGSRELSLILYRELRFRLNVECYMYNCIVSTVRKSKVIGAFHSFSERDIILYMLQDIRGIGDSHRIQRINRKLCQNLK
jgi:hypothetical protein